MAGEMMSKEELGSVLLQAMLAAKNLRPQRDRLLQLRRRLQQQLRPGDEDMAAGMREYALDVEHIIPAFAATLNELAAMAMDVAVTIKHCDLASELSAIYYVGLDTTARPLATCLEMAASSGARLALDPAFAALLDEQLFDALVAQRLPARPTAQAEAFPRVEAAVKLCKEHHLPTCIEHLFGIRPPLVASKHEGNRVDAAATEHDTKNQPEASPVRRRPEATSTMTRRASTSTVRAPSLAWRSTTSTSPSPSSPASSTPRRSPASPSSLIQKPTSPRITFFRSPRYDRSSLSRD